MSQERIKKTSQERFKGTSQGRFKETFLSKLAEELKRKSLNATISMIALVLSTFIFIFAFSGVYQDFKILARKGLYEEKLSNTIHVTGRVFDLETGLPIPNVTIIPESISKYSYTDSLGNFKIDLKPNSNVDEFSIYMISDGYESKYIRIPIPISKDSIVHNIGIVKVLKSKD